MDTQADIIQEDKNQSLRADEPQVQGGGGPTFRFLDNRPEAVAQRGLQGMADNSRQVSQLRAFHDMANNGPQGKQPLQLRAMKAGNAGQHHQPVQLKKNDVVQRMKDKNGEEITIERVGQQDNLETLREWAGLEADWMDFEIVEAIKARISALEPAPAEVETPVAEDKQEAKAPVTGDVQEAQATVAKRKPKLVRKKDLKMAERKAKQAERHAQHKPQQAEEKAERPALPPGTVYLDQLPEKGGTNKTRSWGDYPHVSVLLGSVNTKNNSVELKDFHYSFGAKDTHLHWISKGGGNFEFVQDTSKFTDAGIKMLAKAYTEVEKRATKLGCVALKPDVLSE